MTIGSRRLTESDALAVAWLEAFQEREFAALDLTPPQSIMFGDGWRPDDIANLYSDRTDDFARQLKNSIDLVLQQPGSRYDDPLSRAALHDMGRDFHRLLEPKLGVALPIFGYSPRSSPNAQVFFHRKSGRYIVVFNKGQLSYLTLAVGALIAACPLTTSLHEASIDDLSFSDKWLNVDSVYLAFPWMLKGILEAILKEPKHAVAIVKDICKDYVQPFKPTNAQQAIISSVFDSISRFILAHEFGHIVFDASFIIVGDFVTDVIADNDKPLMRETLRRLADETRSDDIGIQLLIRNLAVYKIEGQLDQTYMNGESCYLGVMMFFYLSLFLNHCISMVKYGTISEKVDESSFTTTHPSLNARIEEARKSLDAHLDSEEIRSYLDSDSIKVRGSLVTHSFIEIIYSFWALMEPLLEEWHKKGAASELSLEYR